MIDLFVRHLIPAAYAVLPERMASPKATALLACIGLQESKFEARCQVLASGNRGPARGFFQFEQLGGIVGVMTHRKTREPLVTALTTLRYGKAIGDADLLHHLVEHNDVVAAVFARLLLWTVPAALPSRDQPGLAWDQYLEGWRPGKPHKKSWHAYYEQAWALVDAAPG